MKMQDPVPSLLAALRKGGGARGWAWFLDLDGTLIDLAPRPGDVVCPPGLTATLAALDADAAGALAIVTGRSADFAAALLGTRAFTVAGLHGAEIRPGARLGGGPLTAAPAPPPAPAADHAAAAARAMPGVIFEDKGAAFALHFRLAPRMEARVAQAMAEALTLAGAGYRLRPGKAVVELCPADADKGAALRRLMRHPAFGARRPFAAGDDLTDEAMFAAAGDLGGLSVRIGAESRETCAPHALPSPAAMRALLSGLVRPQA